MQPAAELPQAADIRSRLEGGALLGNPRRWAAVSSVTCGFAGGHGPVDKGDEKRRRQGGYRAKMRSESITGTQWSPYTVQKQNCAVVGSALYRETHG